MRPPSTSIPLDLAVFRPSADSAQRPRPLNFAPGSSQGAAILHGFTVTKRRPLNGLNAVQLAGAVALPLMRRYSELSFRKHCGFWVGWRQGRKRQSQPRVPPGRAIMSRKLHFAGNAEHGVAREAALAPSQPFFAFLAGHCDIAINRSDHRSPESSWLSGSGPRRCGRRYAPSPRRDDFRRSSG